MCVIFFYVNSKPEAGGYKLILASNRDEFYARETQPAKQWKNDNGAEVYGGIDMEPGREGGTWLAIGAHKGVFKVGALLNLTGEPKPRNAIAQNNGIHRKICNGGGVKQPTIAENHENPIQTKQNNNLLLGRGMLVTDFVNSTQQCGAIKTYNQDLLKNGAKYSAFNFVAIEISNSQQPALITLCSNMPAELQHYEERKFYGFGNSLPAAPFQKVQQGRARFEEIVQNYLKQQNLPDSIQLAAAQQQLISNLLELLKSKEKHWPDAELKRRAPNWGEHLSAINVSMPQEHYGSRTHSIILVDANDKLQFIEHTMASNDAAGEWLTTHIQKQCFDETENAKTSAAL